MRLKSRCPLTRFRVSRPCARGSSPCVSAIRDGWTSGRALVTLQSEEDYTPLTGPPESTATWFHTSPGENGLLEMRTVPRAAAGALRRDPQGDAGGSPPTQPLAGRGQGVLGRDPLGDAGRGPLTRPPDGRRRESSDATPGGTQAGDSPTRPLDGRRRESSDATPGWTQKQGAPTPGRHWESEWHSLPPEPPQERKQRLTQERGREGGPTSPQQMEQLGAQGNWPDVRLTITLISQAHKLLRFQKAASFRILKHLSSLCTMSRCSPLISCYSHIYTHQSQERLR